jgi:GT2 family glycosyltransferase
MGTEVFFVSQNAIKAIESAAPLAMPACDIYYLETGRDGRAPQLNAGAEKARGQYLWFLHADSKFAPNTIAKFLHAIDKHPNSLLYFDLVFLPDAGRIMALNGWGARLRSRIFKVPFGDQGLCLEKTAFESLGGFPEKLSYGEDHIFVWKAKQAGITVQPVRAKIYTASRKYLKYGWARTTLMHQYQWLAQAWPEWKKLRRKKN